MQRLESHPEPKQTSFQLYMEKNLISASFEQNKQKGGYNQTLITLLNIDVPEHLFDCPQKKVELFYLAQVRC